MLALIRRVGTEFGMDIVISSHHLEEAERICDAVVILGDGDGRAGREPQRAAPRHRAARRRRRRPDAELAALLRGAGFDVAERRARCSASRGRTGVHDAVRDAVADLGVGIRRLAAERQTLEDVYMEASA